MSGEPTHLRCQPPDLACAEVYERVREAEIAIHVHGNVAQGEQLLATARRIAEAHHYGQPHHEDDGCAT